jgi:hypothetical protein
VDPDYDSLDPELRTKKYLALISAGLGVISVFAALIPICGGITGLIGVIVGYLALNSEFRKSAIIGIILSSLGIIISFVYMVMVSFK